MMAGRHAKPIGAVSFQQSWDINKTEPVLSAFCQHTKAKAACHLVPRQTTDRKCRMQACQILPIPIEDADMIAGRGKTWMFNVVLQFLTVIKGKKIVPRRRQGDKTDLGIRSHGRKMALVLIKRHFLKKDGADSFTFDEIDNLVAAGIVRI